MRFDAEARRVTLAVAAVRLARQNTLVQQMAATEALAFASMRYAPWDGRSQERREQSLGYS